MSKAIRLQKFIADCGITSRRKAETYITEGRVVVNGRVELQLGTKVDPNNDVVSVDGKVADFKAVEKIYMVMHKPRSYMTTLNDPEGRQTIMDLCKEISERIYPVGRLDYLSEGLIILTNDGEFGNTIIHPKSNIEKVYEVKVFGAVNHTLLKKLREGVQLEEGFVKPVAVRVLKQLPTKTWLEFRLSDGKNREIRRICEACGITVDKLKRIAIGGLTINGIAPGKFTLVTKKFLLKEIGINEQGEKLNNTQTYFSNKKSVNVKKLNPKKEVTSADSFLFQKFRKSEYYESLKMIEESKKIKAKEERTKAYLEKEEARKERLDRKKARQEKKEKVKKFVHAQFVK